jgi:hypothetical protein
MTNPSRESTSAPASRAHLHPFHPERERECPNSRARLDRRLDLALEQTFPASDPVAVLVW